MRKDSHFSVLITAGGTREDIDDVRSISNHATGRLGSLIADVFFENGAKVTYLCGEESALPKSRDCEIIKIRNVAQLSKALDGLLHKNLYDCVIHSMAVSDFTPHAVMTADEMAEAIQRELSGRSLSKDEISERIQNVILNGAQRPAENKISSKSPYMMMILKQTPKVIGQIKTMQPQTLLVGFKLLSGVSEAELLTASLKLIENNGCDYVLANDLSGISGDVHKAMLIDKDGIMARAGTKLEIAGMIFKSVTERIDGAK